MSQKAKLRFFLLGIALLAALAAASLMLTPLDSVDNLLNDLRMRLAARPTQEARIVIVDLDDRSLAKEGVWPWPRARIASLLQILLDDYKVASVAVDIVFPEAHADEGLLAAQFRRPEVTSAVVYDLGQRDLPIVRTQLPPPPPLASAAGAPMASGLPVVANHPGLQSRQAGHITPYFDPDGVLRRLPPVICSMGASCRPTLGVASFAGLLPQARLQMRAGRGWRASPWELAVVSDGAELARLPLTQDGNLIVPYRHTGKTWMRRISAIDILERKADPALLGGVMVLMGGTALGMGDVISTPIGPVAAGMETHAEVMSALLDNDFFISPTWGLLLDAALLLPFAVLLVWLLSRLNKPGQRAGLLPAWLAFTWAVLAMAAYVAMLEIRLLLPLIPLVLFPPLAVLLIGLVELYRAGSEHDGVFSLLASYLPKPVATRLASLGPRGQGIVGAMDATRREITVLFADVHGFAGITEDRPPEVVARLMHRIFSEMAESVVQHHGTIDKFIGDAIMAFWNAPEDDPDHAHHALACAYDILQRMQALAGFCAELDLPPINIGVGIESGLALVGNFGSAHRRTFTALGEPVVLASRLEGLTKIYNESVLAGPGCAAILGEEKVRQLSTVQIRGRVHPLTLFIPK